MTQHQGATSQRGKGFIYFGIAALVLGIGTSYAAWSAGNPMSGASGFLFAVGVVLLIVGFAKRR